MAENLNYDNGCYTMDDAVWTNGTYSSCRHNTTAGTEAEARAVYGLLYQWQAAMNDACPTGWKLPSDGDGSIGDFEELEMYLGMSEAEATSTDWRYSGDVGSQLKGRDDLWGTNCADASTWNDGVKPELCHISNFNALPGSYIDTSGTFYSVGWRAYFWSSFSGGASTAWRRYLGRGGSGVNRNTIARAFGFSVRCLRD